jgi:hypothetical protein
MAVAFALVRSGLSEPNRDATGSGALPGGGQLLSIPKPEALSTSAIP